VRPVAPQKTVAHLCRIFASSGQRKHLFRWLRSRNPTYVLDVGIPWLTFDAVDELVKRLRPNPVVFEFGSGGSTLFWLKQGAHCTSVEHDPEWFALVRQRIGNNDRLDYRLIPPDIAPVSAGSDPADPLAYRSADAAFANRTFKNYVRQIDEFPDQHFDVVLIDGRARPSCLMHSNPKVKPGGLLILDNTERDYYTVKAGAALENFFRSEFFGVGPTTRIMWRTDIYQRR
jgi:SAM-dependent methyltransferase